MQHHMHEIFSVPIASMHVDEGIAEEIERVFLERLDNLPLRDVDVQYSDFTEEQADQILDVKKDFPNFWESLIHFKDSYAEETGLKTTDGYFRSWTQDYRDVGQHHRRHHHGSCGISGVYWIRANENAEPLTFYTPNTANKYTNYEAWVLNKYSAQSFSFPAERGTILLFPSYLEHEVGLSTPGTVRSTLAFNFNYINENI